MESEAPTTDNQAQPVPEAPVAAPVTAPVEPPAQRPHNKKPLVITLGVLILAGIGGGLYWQFGRTQPAKVTSIQASPSVTPVPSSTPDSKATLLLQRFTKPTTGETWLPAPKKLAAQGFLKDGDTDAEYYQLGMRGTSTIILSVVSQVGEWNILYEKTAAGNVTVIAHPDGEAVYNADSDTQYASAVSSKVKLDTVTHYDSLTMPLELPLAKGYVVKKPTHPDFGSLIRPVVAGQIVPVDTVVAKYGGSTLVKTETTYADTKLTSIGYNMLTAAHMRVAMSFMPLELSLTGYQWQSGATPVDTISPINRGCSLSTISASRSDVLTAADVQVIGKSPSGVTVYELKSLDNPLMTKAYQEFIDFYKGTDANSTPYFNITKAKFATEHGVIVIKDNYGQWLVYARDQLRPMGGCAKPVIYLYPQQAEQVSVRVGARVKVSLPTYDPFKGWNVWATPSGSLSVAGAPYDSLFWEGPGLGAYPGITSGTVVARSRAAGTIRQQLAQQGLVGREIDDFMAYWEPKLPNKPYVRLTWFNTGQMNVLAPLAISPKPTTVLRVFLDFDGLDSPINLPAQHLTSTPRQGFTVVEWGGLANFPLK